MRYLICLLCAVVTAALAKTSGPESANLAPSVLASHIVTIEHFNPTGADSLRVERDAGKARQVGDYVSGKWGSGLRLQRGVDARIPWPGGQLDNEGTISFWVKPEWGASTASHTFLSRIWDKKRKNYLVISYGWWEPKGENRLYFVVDNTELLHCVVPYRFEDQVWVLITAVWKRGADGYCRLYVDDKEVARTEKRVALHPYEGGDIFLGSDRGTPDARARNIDGVIDELIIYNRALTANEVKAAYREQENTSELTAKAKRAWLETGLRGRAAPRRDAKGRLLESRIVFDEDIRWALSQHNTDEILNKIEKAGFNVYVPCVWHGKGAYYPSGVAHMDASVLPRIRSDQDPLEYLITQARKRGIEVHPWFTVVRREDERYPEFFDSGTPEDAYDIHNAKFRAFIVDLMIDVVKRYDVDGINLDYIRAMGICRSKSCQRNYKSVTGHDLLADLVLKNVSHAARERIEAWQDAAVADIVESFSKRARALKPKITISADGHPASAEGNRPLDGRDLITWANKGWLDVVFNMDYRERVDAESIDRARQRLKVKEKMIVLFGNYDRIDGKAQPRSGELVAKYIEYSRRQWPGSGVALYLLNLLSPEQVTALATGPFSEPAVPDWPRPLTLAK